MMECGFYVEDRRYAVKLEEIESGREFVVTVNGKRHHVLLKVDTRGGSSLEFVADNKPRRITILPRVGMDRIQVSINGSFFSVNRSLTRPPLSSRHITPARPKDPVRRAGRDEGILSAPTPGKIVLIKVKKGDQVKEGDALLILESMKMETTLKAHRSGTVEEVKVRVGDNVSRGELVMRLKRAGDLVENDD